MERRLWATRGRRHILNCFSASVASCGFQLHSFHFSFGFIVSFIISVSTRWLSRQSISVFQQALCIIKTWCVMRLLAVTCRLLFIFGRCKRGGSKRRRERTVAWGVCVCWGFGEITKTLPELVPLLGKQQSLSCSVPLSGLFLSLSLYLCLSLVRSWIQFGWWKRQLASDKRRCEVSWGVNLDAYLSSCLLVSCPGIWCLILSRFSVDFRFDLSRLPFRFRCH